MPDLFDNFDDFEPVSVPDPSVLESAKVDILVDMLVGKQITRLREFSADEANNPKGGATVGFEFRSHDRFLAWIFPVPRGLDERVGYCAAICPQYWPAQSIITRSMERRMTSDRSSGERVDLEFYDRIEGEVIRGTKMLDEANQWGGQSLWLEFAQGWLKVHALPGSAHGLTSRYTANYALELKLPPRRLVSLPFGGVVSPRLVTPFMAR